MLQKFSTNDVPPRQRLEYWNEVACRTFTQMSVDPVGSQIDAQMQRATVGDMRMALATSTGSKVGRSSGQVALSRDAFFMLHVHLAGTSRNRQDGREIVLGVGDFALFDSTRPYQINFEHSTSILVLRIPQAVLRRVIACPESVTMLPMPCRDGANRLASRFIRDVWDSLSADAPVEESARLCRPMLDVLANAYAAVPAARSDSSSMAEALRVQIRSFIEEYLGDPNLGVPTIATAFGISARYVHMLFKGDGGTVSDYIQGRRMEEAAQALADPLHARVGIGDIAVAHGFKSQAHFCRLFRQRYGTTPRDYRR